MAEKNKAVFKYKIADYIENPGALGYTADVVHGAFFFANKDEELTEAEAKAIVKRYGEKKII